MKIIATYANRKHDPDVVELVDAWDEFSVEDNFDGWQKSRQKALDSWGKDLLHWVTVEIHVPMGEVYKALNPELELDAPEPVIVEAP